LACQPQPARIATRTANVKKAAITENRTSRCVKTAGETYLLNKPTDRRRVVTRNSKRKRVNLNAQLHFVWPVGWRSGAIVENEMIVFLLVALGNCATLSNTEFHNVRNFLVAGMICIVLFSAVFFSSVAIFGDSVH
jgi:hypothetical protein